MKQSLIYSLKVWLTAVIIVPFIQLIQGLVVGNPTSISNAMQIILLSMLFGLILSSPSWLLLWLSTYYLNRLTGRVTLIKLILSIISFVLAWLPFVVISGSTMPSSPDFYWFSAYPIVILAGVWFYRLNPDTNSVLEYIDDVTVE